MGQYEYDDTGAIFNYFLLSILSLLLIPSTFTSIFGLLGGGRSDSKADKSHARQCDCAPCQAKRSKLEKRERENKPLIPFKLVMFVLGWALFGFVAYQVYVTPVTETVLWDPYSIMGISESATADDIKRAFRKLSLKHHPDKVPESEKESAAQIFIEISKAHKVLTDEEARKTFDEFGHPDGKQATSLGIALPKWLVDAKNNLLVLFIYGAVFGIGLPFWVARWWYNAKNVTGDKIQHATMARFYKELRDATPTKPLIDMLTKSNELLTTIPYRKSEKPLLESLGDEINAELLKIGDKFNSQPKLTTMEQAVAHKVLVLLLAHMLRIKVKNPLLAEEQETVILKSAHVCNGLLQISAARFWLASALNAIDLRQMIVQGSVGQKGALSQLPHLTQEMIKGLGANKKRPVVTIRQLLEFNEEELAERLDGLSEQERRDVVKVAEQYPILRICKAHLSVAGEELITPGSIVTLHVKIELITVEELRRERVEGHRPLDTELEEEPKKKAWFDKKDGPSASQLHMPHAPMYPESKPGLWWVMLADRNTNRLICLNKITDMGLPGCEPRSVRLQFQAPPKAGEWNFHVFVKSDSVMGCDGLVPLLLKVEDAVVEEIQEDEISEPDEDTIAGQMHAIRTGKALAGLSGNAEGDDDEGAGEGGKRSRKGGKEENEDSSDSEED